jgi:acetyl-CoA carboxylase carboxyl transferase subunit beta
MPTWPAKKEKPKKQRAAGFSGSKKGILTPSSEKKETPEGLWTKCPECNHICTISDLREQDFVCPKCNFHHRIGSNEYYNLLFDDKQYTELVRKHPKQRLLRVYGS